MSNEKKGKGWILALLVGIIIAIVLIWLLVRRARAKLGDTNYMLVSIIPTNQTLLSVEFYDHIKLEIVEWGVNREPEPFATSIAIFLNSGQINQIQHDSALVQYQAIP